MKVDITKAFEPMYNSANHNIINNAGRVSAKSYNVSLIAAMWLKNYPEHDVFYFRATTESLQDSIFNELCEKLDLLEIPYKTKTSPCHIVTGYGNEVYFRGIDGSVNRTKGIKPKRKVSMIIIEEAEELRSELHLRNAVESVRRHLDTSIDYKIIYVGNNMPIKTHWWNQWAEKYKRVQGYISLNPTYKDIRKHLSKDVLDNIELEFNISPQVARYMYLNIVDDMAGSAYPSFRRDRHLISPEQAGKLFYGETIEAILWGGDGAITHDMTGVTPIAVMTSGRCCILERFVFDPIRHGRALAPSELAEAIERYVEWMDKKYGIIDNNIASYFVIDCASEDLITQLRYTLSDYHTVKAYTTKNIIRNNSCVNNCFARNMCYIVDYGGYMDFVTNKWVATTTDMLADQLESVVWKGNKYDPKIPNDLSDALTYGLSVYYENTENLYLPERLQYYEEIKQ